MLATAGHDAITIVAEEPNKSLDRMTDIIVALRERRVTRETTLVALGGGVIQDIAAFVASIYMRGIAWVYVPTTLLSMTDSCIGGKSSINVGKYKNIVGTFYPPRSIVIDPQVTVTLSVEQRVAGLVEAAKICFCRSEAAFAAYLALAPSPDSDAETLTEVIQQSLRAKKYFIEIDEFDRGERLLLNFGHSFGHAIEAASHFRVSHGIAVGLGMLTALRLGEALGGDGSVRPRVAALAAHIEGLLDAVPRLDAAIAGTSGAALMDAFGSDKKHGRDRFSVVLVDDSGLAVRRALPRDATSSALIEAAFVATLDARAAPVAAR